MNEQQVEIPQYEPDDDSVAISRRTWAEVASEGTHNATILSVENLGMVRDNFGLKETMQVMFQMNDQTDEDGEPVKIWQRWKKSLNDESSLLKFLTMIGVRVPRNTPFSIRKALVGWTGDVEVKRTRDPKGRLHAEIKLPRKKEVKVEGGL
jgi:hypothetical protein